MPLIKCPECGRMVSDRAAECPHCGGPLKQESSPQDYQPDTDAPVSQATSPQDNQPVMSDDEMIQPDEQPSRRWLYAVIAALVIVLAAGIGYYFYDKGQKQKAYEREVFVKDSLAQVRRDSLEQVRRDSIEQARQDSIARAAIAHDYKVVKINSEDFFDSNRVAVISNGKQITTSIGEMWQFVDVLDEHDYDGNGINDCLVEKHSGGNGAIPSYFFIVYYDEEKKRFKETEIPLNESDNIRDMWGIYGALKRIIEKKGNQWLITFKLGQQTRVYQFDGKEAVLIESGKKSTAARRVFTMMNVFNTNECDDDLKRTIMYDINGDGKSDTFVFTCPLNRSTADLYAGDLNLIIYMSNQTEPVFEDYADFFSILSSKTKGMYDILEDDRILYKWNGSEYVRQQ